MPKIERNDTEDSWHHVTNRGLAHRTIIEDKKDARKFMAFMARAVRSKLLEVHSFCLMTNHFHVLARSKSGHLSEAMRRIQQRYVLWFNRSRDRDGPLFRGRYCSRRIHSEAHWANVIRYIDENATEARIVHDSAEYPYCSRYYYGRARGPRWLKREKVEREVCAREGSASYSPELYDAAWSRTPLVPGLVERRLGPARLGPDAHDDLVAGSPLAVQQWMLQQALLADGTAAGSPVAASERVMACIDQLERSDAAWQIRVNSRHRPGWPILRAGLLRTAAGLRHGEIAPLLGRSENTAGRMVAMHAALLVQDADYRVRISRAFGAVHFARRERDHV
ncbi:MAG TPA: transposase [Planctomycetota bacterium]|nr:transposase [Planctomycetota bacterium]